MFSYRGAAGYRPENTIESFALADRMGADYPIRTELVSTKDGVLVARHDNDITRSTDVATRPEFRDRKTTKKIDGVDTPGWFTEDFTLRELRTLRAVETIPEIRKKNAEYDGKFKIPTLEKILTFAERTSEQDGRAVRMLFETTRASYFRGLGLPLEKPLIAALKKHGLNRDDGTVVLGSSQPTSLAALGKALDVPLVQNIGFGTPDDGQDDDSVPSYEEMQTPAGLRKVAKYATWIAPTKELIIPVKRDGTFGEPTTLVSDAHEAGLKVVPWIFRDENGFLPESLKIGDDPSADGDVLAEYEKFFAEGVDGVMSDCPDTTVKARKLRD